jgi:enamine deaminase RidA (YjgF/YER057c/UK114 family)
VRIINPAGLVVPRGFGHVAVAQMGILVEVAGQTPVDAEGNLLGGDDIEAQARAAMTNLRTALRAAGAGWEHVVRRTIYTTRPTQFLAIGRGLDSVTGSVPAPPQSIVGVSGLVRPEFLLEIEATAVLSTNA